jgi:hypothetical protein
MPDLPEWIVTTRALLERRARGDKADTVRLLATDGRIADSLKLLRESAPAELWEIGETGKFWGTSRRRL